MATNRRSLGKPAKAEVITADEAAKFAKMYLRLDGERREAYRIAAAKTKSLEGMEAVLIPFIDANKKGRARTVTVGKHVLRVAQKDKGLYYKGALIDEIGETEFLRRMKAAGTEDDLEIDILP